MTDELQTQPTDDAAPLESVTETPDEPVLPKHIKVRINDPAHFSAYKTIPYRRTVEGKNDTETAGVQVSYGVWKTTGAETAQVYLFDREQGWDDDKVEAWFQARPYIHRPVKVAVTQAVNDTLLDVPVTLAEADTDFRKFKVHVIREGWGKNRRLGADGRYYRDYFPKPFLQQLCPMLEQSAVQAVRIEKTDTPGKLTPLAEEVVASLKAHGHPDTIINQIHQYGFADNTIGFLRNVSCTENAVADEAGTPRAVNEAIFEFEDCQAAQNTRRLVKSAWSKGLKQALGLSVNYRANASFGEIDGRPAFIFNTPTHHVSTELVPSPAAGGGFISVLQSMQDNLDVKDNIQGGASATPEQEKPAAVVTDVPAAQAEQPKERIIVDEKTRQELAAAQAELAATKAAQDALKAQMDAFMQAQAAEKAQRALEVIVTQSELDKESQAVLLQEIAEGGLPTEKAVKSAIALATKARQFAIAATQAQQSAPVFPGMSRVAMGKSPADVASIRSKLLWDVPLTQSEQEMQKQYGITRYLGVQDEYKAVTGDVDLTWRFSQDHFKQMTGAFAQSTSMTTDTYPEFLKNVLSLRVERHWMDVDKSHLKVVKIGEPFGDTRPEDEYLLGKMSDIAAVSEDGAYNEVSAPYKEKVTSNAVKYGNILSFSEETILNDNVDLIKQTTDIFTEAMNTTMASQVWKMLCNYSTAFNDKNVGTTATNGVLYDASLNNVVDGNVTDIDKVRDLVDLMMTQTDIAPEGETGQPLILMPYLAVTNVKNAGVAQKILNGEYEITSSNVNDVLSLGFTPDRIVGVHPNYLYTKTTALFLLPNPQLFAGMELRYFRGKTSPDLIYEGSQLPQYGYSFSNDRMLLKLKMRWRLTLKRKKAFFALYPSA